MRTVRKNAGALKLFTVLLIGLAGALPTLQASDHTGVYALVDKVVFEPAEGPPQRIQIWGAFSLAAAKSGNKYKAPQKGYLYYTLPEVKPKVAAIEWADLKAIAGKGAVIGFGSRPKGTGTVRKAKIKPNKPDVYQVGWGLIRMKNRHTDYPPIRDLLALKKSKSTENKEAKD